MRPADEIVYDSQDLAQWIFDVMGCGYYGYRTVGLRRSGEFVAGVLLDRFGKYECQMHIATLPGVHWATPELCRIAFSYPFGVLNRTRVTAETAVSHTRMVRMNRRLGFVQEGVKRNAAMDGGDAIVFGMLRDECRWIKD